MTDEEIFDLAEQHGWQDDFGRWNFKDDDLLNFALALRKAEREWVGLTDEERFLNDARSAEEIEYAKAIEAKLKEKNT